MKLEIWRNGITFNVYILPFYVYILIFYVYITILSTGKID